MASTTTLTTSLTARLTTRLTASQISQCGALGEKNPMPRTTVGDRFLTNRDPKYVFVDSNRDLLSEIGYADDKLRLIPVFRQVEWDPTFWSLDEEIVQWFNNDDEAAVQNKIKELQLSISEKEAMLVNVRKNMRLKNKERGAFRPSLDVFPSLVEPPNEDEPSSDLNELAVSICKLVKELKNAKLENLENELKLASMDEKISRIREVAKKSLEDRNKNYNVNAHLMAVETQNSMLHELLTVIVQKIKQTQQDVENLKSTDTKTLVIIIKENSELNFKIINACYPNMESKPGVGQWLWLPHDVKQMGFDDYLKTIKPKDRSLDITIDWKQLKKNVKEVEESCELLKSLKKKVRWRDHKKACGLEGSILYMTEEQIRAISWGPIHEVQF
uniref:Tip elongation aberrant protein 3 n=1 Tax=Lygus hesperus TaxID=30085 RepID=A0A0A9YGE6_LYGHE